MNSEELKRIREWCHERMANTVDPLALAELVKLCDVVAALEAGGRPETDAEIQALAERIVQRGGKGRGGSGSPSP
jgi:hypothetical protein